MQGSWWSALKADFDHSPKQVTAELLKHELGFRGDSDSVYKMLRGELPFKLTYLEKWARYTGAHEFMRWAGHVCNYFVAPIPAVAATPLFELPAVLRESADVIQSVNDALQDGRMTPREAARIRREGEQLIAATYAVILAAEKQATTVPLRPATLADAS